MHRPSFRNTLSYRIARPRATWESFRRFSPRLTARPCWSGFRLRERRAYGTIKYVIVPYITMVQTHRLSPCQHVRGEGVAEPFLYAITSTGRF